MFLRRGLLAVAVSLLALAASARQPQSQPAVTSRPQADPFAPVYVVTSVAHARHMPRTGRSLGMRVDPAGRALVMVRYREHQIRELSAAIHAKADRCGGYFAFATQAEAEDFIRNDMTATVMAAGKLSLLNDPLRIDNAANVGPAMSQISTEHMGNVLWTLSTGFPNRHYASAHGANAAAWIRNHWSILGAGRSDVTTELFNCATCGVQPSVILTIHGSRWPDEIVVLGAHLDSISNVYKADGVTLNAPGADDDASGIATLSEVLRVAMERGWRPKRTVKLMGYAAEEVGLRGSRAIAQSFALQGRKVVGVLQLDMTNYKTGAIDMRLVTDYSSPVMQQYLVDLFDTYLAPLGHLRGTITCGYGCSDHAAWTASGYPSAMMFEPGAGTSALGDSFPYIHTPNDTLGNMGNTMQPSVAFARLGLAFLGELGDVHASPLPPVPGRDAPRQPAPTGGVPGGKR